MQNYYKLFAVEPTATEAALRQAIRNALRLWSNRTNAPQIERRQEAERMVKAIQEAETILLSPTRRAEYNRQLSSAPADTESADKSSLDSSKDLIAEGRRLLSAGHVADALYVATKATERDGANADAWALLGEARFRFGDIEDAIYEYKRAIKLKPNEPFYYYDLGDIYIEKDKLDEALTQYKRAADMAPEIPMFRAAVGRVFLRQGRSAAAIPILDQCVREDPDNEYFQWELAIAYVDSAQDSWTFVPEGGTVLSGRYATSKAQVLEALSFIAKAESLKFTDQELKDHITRIKGEVTRMLKRRYFGSTTAAIIGGILWCFIFCLGLVFAPLYFLAARPPQYAINRRILGGRVTGHEKAQATAAKVGEFVGASENVASGVSLVVAIATGLFLPIMVIWNFIENYTGENALGDINQSIAPKTIERLEPVGGQTLAPPTITDVNTGELESREPVEGEALLTPMMPVLDVGQLDPGLPIEVQEPKTASLAVPSSAKAEVWRPSRKHYVIGALVAVLALALGLTVASWLGQGHMLSYSLSLDEERQAVNLMPIVTVDGIQFSSGRSIKPGRHLLNVRSAGIETFDRHFWVIFGDKDLGTLPLESSKGGLAVTVNPTPAIILVKRGDTILRQGQAPFSVDRLPVGDYVVIVRRGEYEESRTIRIQRDQTTESKIELDIGSVELSCDPPDADFELFGDGRNGNGGRHWSGKTPIRIDDVAVGNYQLRVERKGWKLEANVWVNRGSVANSRTEFPYGSIVLTSEPSGLATTCNGMEVGRTPITLRELKPGPYTLTATDGENELSADITVGPREQARHSFAFHYGTVHLTSTPPGATVFRKGKEIGTTPLTLAQLAVGLGAVVDVRLNGYAPSLGFALNVVEGVTTNLNAKLFSERYVQAMKHAREAIDATQFSESQTFLTAALESEPNDSAALKLRDEVSKAEEALRTEQANAKVQALASLPWLDFDRILTDCTETKQVQYPVELADGYYQEYVDNNGKKRSRFVQTGKHTEMRTSTESTFNDASFAAKCIGKTYKFDSAGWKIAKIEKDGTVVFRRGSGKSLEFGQVEIRAIPSAANQGEFLSLKDSQRITIRARIGRHDRGNFFSRVLHRIYLEDAEILDEVGKSLPSWSTPKPKQQNDVNGDTQNPGLLDQLVTLENKISEFAKSGDRSSIDSMLDPAFTLVDHGRPFSRSAYLSTIKPRPDIISFAVEF